MRHNPKFKILRYASPLKNCRNEKAKTLAEMVEQQMIELIDLSLSIVECRVKQVYEYAAQQIEEKEKKRVN